MNDRNFVPIFDKNDKSTIILSDLFAHKQCIEYAKIHNFKVIFTETTACNSVEIIVDFIENDFHHKFIKKPVYSNNGIYLFDKIQCEFIPSKTEDTRKSK
jgi:hypothetical protein